MLIVLFAWAMACKGPEPSATTGDTPPPDDSGPTCDAIEGSVDPAADGCVMSTMEEACAAGTVPHVGAGACPSFTEYVQASGFAEISSAHAAYRCDTAEAVYDVVSLGYGAVDTLWCQAVVFDEGGRMVAFTRLDHTATVAEACIDCSGTRTGPQVWVGTPVGGVGCPICDDAVFYSTDDFL